MIIIWRDKAMASDGLISMVSWSINLGTSAAPVSGGGAGAIGMICHPVIKLVVNPVTYGGN